MSDQIIRKYKGEAAAQRGIDQMRAHGYEVDDIATRKALWSPLTGLFTRKQIHTIVFRKVTVEKARSPYDILMEQRRQAEREPDSAELERESDPRGKCE